jgi:hypothetical protein
LSSSSDESDEDDAAFFLLFPFVNKTFGGGIAVFFWTWVETRIQTFAYSF